MRLVTYLLFKQTILRSTITSLVVLGASLILQLVLQAPFSLNTAIERAVLFGPTLGGAWTIVRWRFYSGIQIVEGLGQPGWITAFIVGSLSVGVMTAFVYTQPTPQTFTVQKDRLNWTTHADTQSVNRGELSNTEQVVIFDKITDALTRQDNTSTLRYGVALIPLGLFCLLLYLGKPEDLWQPIGTTGITLVLIELWYQIYG